VKQGVIGDAVFHSHEPVDQIPVSRYNGAPAKQERFIGLKDEKYIAISRKLHRAGRFLRIFRQDKIRLDAPYAYAQGKQEKEYSQIKGRVYKSMEKKRSSPSVAMGEI